MYRLKIQKMSCGHCVETIKKSLHAVDPAAEVSADLASKLVEVTSARPLRELADALSAAGYPAESIGDRKSN